MTPEETSARPERETQAGGAGRATRTLVRSGLALGILGLGLLAAFWFHWSEGRVRTGEPQEESARLVETVRIERSSPRVTLEALGTVLPAREVVLRPRVSGRILSQAESFVPGGHFEAGERMLKIDPSDYRQSLEQRRSELAQAEATLKIEEGDQAVAQEELRLLEEDIPEINRDLILRRPQVNQAKAAVRSAEAAVATARANLARTRIEAPFDGHLVSRSVSAGSNVSQGEALATLVGSDRYWIEVALPVSHLRWLELPDGPEGRGSPARVTHADAWGAEAFREGAVTQVIGRLEAESRMAQVRVTVPDPLALEPEHEGRPQLILDALVDVHLEGRRIEDVAVVEREHLGEDGVAWVMNGEERLERREVEVAFRGAELAYVEAGLDDGDRLVATNLSAPVEGMRLRTEDGAEPADPFAEEGADG